MLQCKLLTTAEEIRALAEPWRALALRSPAPSVFVTWEWMSAWCDEYAATCHLYCWTAWDEAGRLRGIAPLAAGGGAPLPGGCLGFISSNTRSWGIYLDFIVDPEMSQDALAALLQAAVLAQARRPAIWMVRADAASPTLQILPQVAAAEGLNVTFCADRPCARGPLPASVDEFIKAIPSKSQRKRLRRYQRKVEADGLPMEVRNFSRDSDLGPLLEALAAHKDQRADHFRVGNNLADPSYRRCLHDFLKRLQAQDWFIGMALHLGDDLAATRLGAIYRGTLYSFLASFDHQFAHYGPAHLLLLPFVEEGISRGATQLDFLPGTQAHKATYVKERGHTVTAVVHDTQIPSVWPLLRMLAGKTLRRTAKNWRQRLRGDRRAEESSPSAKTAQ